MRGIVQSLIGPWSKVAPLGKVMPGGLIRKVQGIPAEDVLMMSLMGMSGGMAAPGMMGAGATAGATGSGGGGLAAMQGLMPLLMWRR